MAYVERVMMDAAIVANATIVAHTFHQFAPQGVSGAVIVAESHFAIHTWPEFGYCAIDIFTCGSHTDNDAALAVIKKSFEADSDEVIGVKIRRSYDGSDIDTVITDRKSADAVLSTMKNQHEESEQKAVSGQAWGVLSSVDLTNCNPDIIRSAEKIKEYVEKLCELIEMKTFGDCQVVHFGQDEAIAGYSMVQLIETSLISGHFANLTNNAYIDIFSCKEYDVELVMAFSKEFFQADICEVTVTPRGTHQRAADSINYVRDNDQVFQEEYATFKGVSTRVAIKEKLVSHQSQYQKIEVYDTVSFGNMLVNDGIIMLTDFDNYAYHEMITHVPLITHPDPKRVLIVGGGDCGTLKEVLKHSSVQEVVLCEIDEDVITISQKYFPELTTGLSDQRTQVIVQDGVAYIKSKKNYFDVIIVDSTDFFGIADGLYRQDFYRDMYEALTEDGIAVTQSESMYYDKDFIAQLYKQNKQVFPYVSYYYSLVPTYPSGSIGFSFCSKKFTPFDIINAERIEQLGELKYYNKEIHTASFQLPQTVKNALQEIK
jgi:spermidine synthase